MLKGNRSFSFSVPIDYSLIGGIRLYFDRNLPGAFVVDVPKDESWEVIPVEPEVVARVRVTIPYDDPVIPIDGPHDLGVAFYYADGKEGPNNELGQVDFLFEVPSVPVDVVFWD